MVQFVIIGLPIKRIKRIYSFGRSVFRLVSLPGLVSVSFGPSVWSVFWSVSLSAGQSVVSSVCDLFNRLFGQSVVWSICCLVSLPFGRSVCRLVNLLVGLLVPLSVGHFGRSVCHKFWSIGCLVSLSLGYSFGQSVFQSVGQSVVWSLFGSVSLSLGRSVDELVGSLGLSGQCGLHQMLVKYLSSPQVLLFPRSWRKGLEGLFYGGEALGWGSVLKCQCVIGLHADGSSPLTVG